MINTVKKYLIPHKGNNHKPHLLREGAVTAMFCIGLILFCTSLGSSYLLRKTDFGAAVISAVLVDLTNEHRVQNNQKPLAVNPLLEKAAMLKAKDMAANGYFAHTSPTGITPWQWFSKAGYSFVYAGENLAINFSESSAVEQAWIASPTHHANLISTKFDETGIAVYDGVYQGRPTTFVVQLFGKRPTVRPSSAVASVAPLSTSELNTQKKVAIVSPEVKGESVKSPQPLRVPVEQAPVDPREPAPVLLVNEKTFAVAQNINETEPEVKVDNAPVEYVRSSSVVERLLVRQSMTVQYIYLGFIALVYLVLILTIIVEFRTQHIKNIALGVLLLCFLGALAYINSSYVLSFL